MSSLKHLYASIRIYNLIVGSLEHRKRAPSWRGARFGWLLWGFSAEHVHCSYQLVWLAG